MFHIFNLSLDVASRPSHSPCSALAIEWGVVRRIGHMYSIACQPSMSPYTCRRTPVVCIACKPSVSLSVCVAVVTTCSRRTGLPEALTVLDKLVPVLGCALGHYDKTKACKS